MVCETTMNYRICPGKELADSSLFLQIAMTTATFNIRRARDKVGNEIIPINECLPGIIRYISFYHPVKHLLKYFAGYSHPKPFEHVITPRDERAVILIRSVLDEHPFEKGDMEVLAKL